MKLPIIIPVKLYWDKHDIPTLKELLRDCNIVLMESAIMASFDGFLFGFLLNISVRNANQLIYTEKIILILASFSINMAVLLFVMPVIYHHLQFPYGDL
jgi:hypothetical protein